MVDGHRRVLAPELRLARRGPRRVEPLGVRDEDLPLGLPRHQGAVRSGGEGGGGDRARADVPGLYQPVVEGAAAVGAREQPHAAVHVVAGAAVRHVDRARPVGRRPQPAAAARPLGGGADGPRRVEVLAVVARRREIDAAVGVLDRIGVPEDVDVAAVHRDRRPGLHPALRLGRERLLGLELPVVAAAGVVEPRGVAVEPGDVQAAVGTHRELPAVDGAEPRDRVRPAVHPLPRRPVRRPRRPGDVPQVAAAHRPRVVDEVQPPVGIDRGLGQAGPVGGAQHLDGRRPAAAGRGHDRREHRPDEPAARPRVGGRCHGAILPASWRRAPRSVCSRA